MCCSLSPCSFQLSPAATITFAALRHQLTSLPVADQSSFRQTVRPHPASPVTLVLTVDIAGLLLARLFALVERKLSGKEVLFTLVIDRLLGRKRRRRRGDGIKKEEEEGEMKESDVGWDRMRSL